MRFHDHLAGPQRSARPSLISDNVGIAGTTGFLGPGPTTAIAGLAMAYDFVWAASPTDKTRLTSEASIWTGKVFSGFGFSKTFDSSHDSAVAHTSPVGTVFVLASNAGTNADVVAIIGSANARVSNGTVFGANFVARTEAGLTGVKLVGFEVDVEPAAGVTPAAGSIGIPINIFNSACPGPAIQIGALSGGTWANGIVIGGIAAAGTGLAPNGAAAMDSLINTGAGVFATSAIILSNLHRLRLSGTAAAHAFLYNDASNNIRLVYGSGLFAIRDTADAASLFTFNTNGNLDISGDYLRASTKVVGARVTGYTAFTGTAINRATAYDTATITLVQLAERVRALQVDLTAHGLIGA